MRGIDKLGQWLGFAEVLITVEAHGGSKIEGAGGQLPAGLDDAAAKGVLANEHDVGLGLALVGGRVAEGR